MNPNLYQSYAMNIGIENSNRINETSLIIRADAHSKYPKDYKEKFTTLSKQSDEYKKMGYGKDRGAIFKLTKALNNAVKGMTDGEVRAFVNNNPKMPKKPNPGITKISIPINIIPTKNINISQFSARPLR